MDEEGRGEESLREESLSKGDLRVESASRICVTSVLEQNYRWQGPIEEYTAV